MTQEKEAVIEKKHYKAKVLFSYSTEHLVQKDKIRFYYAVKGRDGRSGIVKQYEIEQLGRAVMLVDEKFAKEVDEFLTLWKCVFERKEVLVRE